MPQIHRTTTTPYFREYITHYAVYDLGQADWNASVAERASATFSIPTFQRGISWGMDLFEDFLTSGSPLLGTVILGTPVHQADALLIDGLQRFSIGTALINALFPLVLRPEPERADLAERFRHLSDEVRTFQYRFAENHRVLSNFSRLAVAKQYKLFSISLDQWLRAKVQDRTLSGLIAENIVSLFLDRQIAIDHYTNIATVSVLLKSFIGLNTVRADLSTVDLIRAELVDQAVECGWAPEDISEMENHLTATFVQDNGKVMAVLVPLATLIRFDVTNHHALFPNWSNLRPADVSLMLDFINSMLVVSDSNKSPWVHAIRTAGALPFAMVTLDMYLKLLRARDSGIEESEVTEDAVADTLGAPDIQKVLRRFYRATVRRVLNGDIGKTASIAERLLQVLNPKTLSELSVDLNPAAAGPLEAAPDIGWLEAALRACGREPSRTVFNAYLLPKRDEQAADFQPLKYGRKAAEYQLDHIIPESQGEVQGASDMIELLVNYCPLVQQDNHAAKNLPASVKLGPQGLYSKTVLSSHPYMDWLSRSQGSLPNLDNPINLSAQRQPPIGDDRITHLATTLSERI